jgi:hypothetical protein
LKQLVGPDRYTLLMAFLPLTSAISGNVGLQASSLTTRAISHGRLGVASKSLGPGEHRLLHRTMLAWMKLDEIKINIEINHTYTPLFIQ